MTSLGVEFQWLLYSGPSDGLPLSGLKYTLVQNYFNQFLICDAIWENPPDVAKGHFEKWLEVVRKLVYNSIELLNII